MGSYSLITQTLTILLWVPSTCQKCVCVCKCEFEKEKAEVCACVCPCNSCVLKGLECVFPHAMLERVWKRG